ncbi:MAG: sulfotransferase [Actinobacteria bacterium]|nr:sulfotransferase [Actinomycetota bacterium]
MARTTTVASKVYRRAKRVARVQQDHFPSWMAREFTEDDLADVPAEWVPRQPDFVGVGTPKAGTTWWYSLLLSHPKVRLNRFGKKEPQFFTVPHFRDVSGRTGLYREGFAAPADCLCGEWSGNYLGYPLAIERLAAAAPDTRPLLLLRNPIDRTVSALNHVAHRSTLLQVKGERASFLWRYSLFPEAVKASFVADDFEAMLHHFPRSRVLVLQYERCRLDPHAEMHKTCEFLGLEPVPLVDERRRVNDRDYLIDRPGPDERAAMAELFADEVKRLVAMCPELDLALWPEFDR